MSIKNFGKGTVKFNEGIIISGSSPQLYVSGNVGFDEFIYHNNDPNTFIQFIDDAIHIECGGRQMIKFVQDSTEKITINNGGMDVDLQIKGLNDANLIRTDAANDRVGIGMTGPDRILDIFDAVDPQLRLTQTDGSNYVDFRATPEGHLEISGSSANTAYKFHSPGHCAVSIESGATDGDAQLGFSVDGGVNLIFSLGVDDGDNDKFKIGTSTVDVNTRLTIDGAGNVGIGTTSPTYTLDVAGDIGIDSLLRHNDDSDTYLRFLDDTLDIFCGNVKLATFSEAAQDTVTINPQNACVDFIVATSGSDHTLFVDGGLDMVGIGTKTPGYNLHVASAASAVVLIDGAAGADAFLRFGQNGTLKSYIKQGSGGNLVMTNQTADKDIIFNIKDNTTEREGLRLNGDVAEVVINEGSDSLVDFRVESNSNTHMLFVDGSSNTVGVNTSTPGSGFAVNSSFSLKVVGPKTSAYTIAEDDSCVMGDCNSSAITLTLPSATDAMLGRIYTIKRIDSGGNGGGNMLTISRNGKNIDGFAGDVLLPNLEALVLQCIGADDGWIRIGSFMAPL